MNKRGICSPHVHVNYIINLIHHVKSFRTVYEQSLLCFKNISRLLRLLTRLPILRATRYR